MKARRKLCIMLLTSFVVTAWPWLFSRTNDAPAEEKPASSAMGEAVEMLKKGDFLEAIGSFREISRIGQRPEERAQALVFMGDVYSYFLDNYDEALTVYGEVIESYSRLGEAANAYFNTGMIFYERNQPHKAAPFFKTYIDLFPSGKRLSSAQFMFEECLSAPPDLVPAPPAAVPEKPVGVAPAPPVVVVPEPRPAPEFVSPVIRVLVQDKASTVKAQCSGRLELADGLQPKRTLQLPAGSEVALTVENGGVRVHGADFAATKLRLRSLDSDTTIRSGGREFRGDLVVFQLRPGTLSVLNELPVEWYLYGVVPREMPPLWPAEALKAQAVAARTYALFMIQKQENKPYDVLSTTMSQVYGGAGAEHAKSNEAVDATRGQVLTHAGKPILAYFHSNSGGRTTSAGAVWSADVPYLVGADDPYSTRAPNYIWEKQLDTEWMEKQLRRAGYSVGKVASIEVTKRDSSGRAEELRIHHSQGNTDISGNQFRLKLGAAVLKSTLFSMRASGAQVQFSGKGFGHGVGMSQWGAYQMAREGHSYEEILRQYYESVQLSKAM